MGSAALSQSFGNPTVEVEVSESGVVGRASSTGASAGEHEALGTETKDPKNYGGKRRIKGC